MTEPRGPAGSAEQTEAVETMVETTLHGLVVAGDLLALRAFVDTFTKADRAAARAWLAKQDDLLGWPGPPEFADLDHRVRFARQALLKWGLLLLVARLEPPVAAVKGVRRWGDGLDVRNAQWPVVVAFTDRDVDWATAFVKAADPSPLPSEGRGAALAFVMRHLVLAHRLPVPTGPLFHGFWVHRSEQWHEDHELTDALRVDPLMPEMLYAHLASGQCGINRHLPRAVADLVDEGRVDRGRVLSVVIEQFTANQRVAGIRVLAGLAQSLGLQADEVAGGLPYLLGVLSTAHSSVAKVVLPLTIDLVRTPDELADLARTVSGRPETALRRIMRKALTPKKLGSRLPDESLVTALDLLAEGEEDVAVRAEIEKARQAFAAAPAEVGPVDDEPVLGLWELEPARAETRLPYYHDLGPYARCVDLMSTGTGRIAAVSEVQDDLLDDLASGDLSATAVLAVAHELIDEDKLSAARTANLLEPLLLGGAMRTLWPVALRVADLAAPPPRPGLDKLLRMLGRYAAEVPGTSVLPPALAQLAQGRSKAAQEARHLGARLARVSPESYDPRSAAEAPATPDRLGLHREAIEDPHPWSRAFGSTPDLDTVLRQVTRTPRQADERLNTVWASVLDSHVLDELVTLIREQGAAAVRAELGAVESYQRGLFIQAVSAWSQGVLTPDSYWRMLRHGVPVQSKYQEWIAELGPEQASRRYHDLEVADGLRLDPPLLPTWWSEGTQPEFGVLKFLHTCEALLVAERGGHLVSTPDVSDGSLGLHNLLPRLAVAPTVGPLDLRLALGRLRPPDASSAYGVPFEVPTDRALTTPQGDVTLSASDMLRRWAGEDGLQLTPSVRAAGHGWDYEAAAPVPWSSLAALQGLDISDAPVHRGASDVWALPGRPDVPLRHGFLGTRMYYSPADVGGELGIVGWDALLLALGARPPFSYAPLDIRTLVRLHGQARLDPAAAARAAQARWDSEHPELIGEATGWNQAFLRGAMGALWPVALAVVEAGLRRPEPPSDLAALVEVLARHVHEVPDPVLPSDIAEAAAEPADGPLHEAVRRLVAGAGAAAGVA